MSLKTAIEWCHHTSNIATGCQKLSAGCKHCYAADLSRINPGVLGTWGPNGTRVLRPEAWRKDILSFARKARKAGERRRVFINSMSDLAEGVTVDGRESRDVIRPDYLPLWDVVIATAAEVAGCLDLLTLTKRPEILADVLQDRVLPPNLWIGASVEDQATANARINPLLRIPARVRFLSCEPLLGPVNVTAAATRVDDLGRDDTLIQNALTGYFTWVHAHEENGNDGERIHWVIVGGESGPRARGMHLDWVRLLRDQCAKYSTPFFFKQKLEGGEKVSLPELDGRQWNEVPDV